MPGQLWTLHTPDCEDRLLLVFEPDQLVPEHSNSVLHVLMAQMGAFRPMNSPWKICKILGGSDLNMLPFLKLPFGEDT